MVDVDAVHRQHAIVTVRHAQGLIEAILEEPPIGQIGQRVVVREVLDPHLRGGRLGQQPPGAARLTQQHGDEHPPAAEHAQQIEDLLQI